MSGQSHNYDVIIVGGGMVGSTLACALGENNFSVALVDTHKPVLSWPEQGYDLRVSALTRASQQILETLHVWPRMQAERISAFREMHVWDAGGEGVLHFDSAELGEATLGHIVENRVTLKALHQQLATLEQVELVTEVQATSLDIEAQHASLSLSNGSILKARLVVAADGSRSWVRQQRAISVRGWDYDQAALVSYVKTARSHQETAWQRFLPNGPLAFLPLPDGYSSIVWSTSPEQAEQLKNLPEDHFAIELQVAFEEQLGEITEVGPRATFPLRFFETNAYVEPRLALVGDAAHTIHPLAGQGVNLGMADAASLAEVLSAARQAKKDIGRLDVLRKYERWRRADNRSMLMAMDGFKRLFSNQSSLLGWLRNSGMNLVQHTPLIKNTLVRHAMGLSGEQPRLAKGIQL
ncbi:MAG: UbiH/UbiF/VisC/COQ6 family ubiquinone biosynthesis hydroxylase [Thioalkalispiraceae bacterium]|jgi:2-octaprenylphenol hydroxylase